jgi:hypothetical protein
MSYQFPKVLKAAEASELSQWAIGDALLAETEDRHAGPRGLNAVSKELSENGIDYSAHFLGSLRLTASVFPRDRRHALSWHTHEEAGNPDTLDVIVRAARKAGHKVTRDYVRNTLMAQRKEVRAEREKAKAEAEAEKAKAEAAERKARDEEREAETAAEKAQAERKRVAATKRRRDAAAKARKAKTMPRKKDRPAPTEEEWSPMVVKAELMANAADAERLAVKTEKTIAKVIDELTPKMVAGLIEDAMSVANAWTRVAAALRKAAPKGSHLSVVNE